MPESIAAQVRALQQMTVGELREKWAEVFGEETHQRHRTYLWKRIAWKVQGDHYAGLTEEEKGRVEQYRDEFCRTPPDQWFPGARHNRGLRRPTTPTHDRRLPPPGSVITHNYKGCEITVAVLEKGFEYQGCIYRSLSAVANEITGTNWNGFTFFGLSKEGTK